jgi:hypothetical protein
MDKNIYEMKLHEKLYFDDFEVMRVPGGWIYYYIGFDKDFGIFVPYNNEYDNRKPEPTPISGSGASVS